jgi:uncharacterized protein (TIGR02996 family)
MPEPLALNEEYLYRIAPDGASVKAAQGLVRKGVFRDPRMSQGGRLLEARARGSMPQPYVVRVDLSDPARPQAACDCGSYKQPCKYALGLILLAGQRPDLFAQDASTVEARRRAPPATADSAEEAPSAETPAPADVGEALLQAILAEPEDDGPRLIYADWLEENGNPDRAEFIRVQMELARVAEGGPRPKELLAREKRLWEAHKEGWLQGFPPRMRKRDLRFHKGFFEELGGYPVNWVKQADDLFASHPIYRVRVEGALALFHLSRMTVLPHLARVRVLVMADCRFLKPEITLQVFFGTPFFTGLRYADLSGCSLGSREVGLLAGSPGLARVAELDLSDNFVGLKGAEHLAGPVALPGLRVLSLANNPLTDAGARALARSPHLDRLTLLDLRGVELGAGARAALQERFGGRLRLA